MTLETSRRGPWMQTFRGRQFWPLDPRTEDVYIDDIAASLSKQCRFAGHSLEFYSVAEHSVRVSLACDPLDALWGLLHDASEAYLVDVPRPIKPYLKEYRSIETNVMNAICKRFGLSETMPESVKQADTALLATEARDLMVTPHLTDRGLEEEALPEEIVPWTHEHARLRFVARFLEIKGIT